MSLYSALWHQLQIWEFNVVQGLLGILFKSFLDFCNLISQLFLGGRIAASRKLSILVPQSVLQTALVAFEVVNLFDFEQAVKALVQRSVCLCRNIESQRDKARHAWFWFEAARFALDF